MAIMPGRGTCSMKRFLTIQFYREKTLVKKSIAKDGKIVYL